MPALPPRTRPSWPSAGPEPALAQGEEVAVGQEVQQPAGSSKVLAHLSQYAGHRRRPIGRLLSHAIGTPAEPLEQPDPIALLGALPVHRSQRPLQPEALALGDQLLGGVIRKDPAQEQGTITEPPVDGRP